MMSIRAQLGLVFALVLLPLLVTAGTIVTVSRSVVADTRVIFDDSLRLEAIDNELLVADQHLRTYLDLRSVESLRGYFESVDRLERVASQLPTVGVIGDRDLSLPMIRRMIYRYLDSTADVVAAGRGRQVPEYTALYRESVRLRELTSLLVSTVYWQDIGVSIDRFTQVSELLNQLVFESGLILIVIAGLAVIAIGVLSRQVAQPIMELSLRAHAVADGAFDLPDLSHDRSAREIADLASSFDVMKHSIKASFDEINRNADIERRLMEQDISVLRMRSSLRSAQLLALQSHINPHFLYNTLNAGVQLAVVEGASRTTEYLERFGIAVRNLLADPSAPITVREEFENLEHYVYVMQTRFGNRIAFAASVADDVRDIQIPPMVLQPLVENSVTHGLKDLETGGRVEVSARSELHRRSETLVIEIRDNGKGFAPEHAAAILRSEPERDRVERSDHIRDPADDLGSAGHLVQGADEEAPPHSRIERGIGIANVVERLRLFFREDDICTIETGHGEGTLIRFSLPIDAHNREDIDV